MAGTTTDSSELALERQAARQVADAAWCGRTPRRALARALGGHDPVEEGRRLRAAGALSHRRRAALVALVRADHRTRDERRERNDCNQEANGA